MWVEELPNGKYKYVERYKDRRTGKNKKISLTHTKYNKRVEKEMFLELQSRIDQLIIQPKNSLSFQELADNWLAAYEPTVKAATYLRNTTHVRALTDLFGSYQLTTLQASDFNSFYLDTLQNKRYVYNTIHQMNSVVKRILRFAYKFNGVDLSHIERFLDVPKINQSKRDDFNFLERHELLQVLDYFRNTHQEEYRNLAYIQVHTGMRYSEMASLRYEDIDFNNNTIHVHRSYDFENKVFTTPKTGDARIVYTNETINRTLKNQIQLSQLKTMQYNHQRDNTLLFKTRNGLPINTHEFNKRLKQVGVSGKNVTSHIFRHTFITMAVENGMDKDLIARQVGHADTTMIDRVYGHFTKKMEQQQKEAMQQFNIV